jgi:hypothetical protein
MSDCYQGDGYEFSIRLPDHRRLHVHVTRAALEFLAGDGPLDQFSIFARYIDQLREKALSVYAQTGAGRIELGPADMTDLDEADAATRPPLH